MVSVYLPSDALSQHLPSYLGFSYLGHGVFLHGCSSKAQPLFLTLDEGYLLTAAPPDLERSNPTSKEWRLLRHRRAERRYPMSEVRGGSQEEQPHVQGAVAARAQEGQEELLHVQGWEGQP